MRTYQRLPAHGRRLSKGVVLVEADIVHKLGLEAPHAGPPAGEGIAVRVVDGHGDEAGYGPAAVEGEVGCGARVRGLTSGSQGEVEGRCSQGRRTYQVARICV